MKKTLSLVLTMCMMLSLFATFVISASAEDSVVSIGATYTASATAHDYGEWAGCSQNADKALTDGEKATDNQYMKPYNCYSGENVGYDKTVTVTLTLDKAYAVTGFNVYTIGGADGSANPLSVSVSVSADGTNWSEAVATTATTSTGSNTWGHNYTLAKYSASVDAVNAQYVKFDIVSGGNQVFVDELEVIGSEASAPVEDKVINLLAQEGTVTVTNCSTDDLSYTLDANSFKVNCHGTDWPNAYLKFNTPVTVNVADAYLEIEATVTGGRSASIRLMGPVDDAGAIETDDIYLQQFDADITLDNGGDAPTESTVSYKLPVSELAYCIYDSANAYAGKNPITTEEITFSGLQVFSCGEGCVVDITKLNLIVPGTPSVPVVKEEITVDGDLNDTGWAKDKWISVDGETGFWQNSYNISIGAQTAPTFGYKYQIRADETKLYVAFVIDGEAVPGGNGNGTFPRLWIRDNDEATIYTSFYNAEFNEDGTIKIGAKYNTSLTENVSANIENSTFTAAGKEVDGKCVFEFAIDLSELCPDGTFDYFVSVHQVVADGKASLLHPAVEIGPVSDAGGDAHMPDKWLPYYVWHTEKDATINVKDIALGEVVVSDKEEADTSMMGTAPATPAFTVTLNTAEGWVAGEKLVVTATVDILEDIDLSQIMFNLYYDAADVEIVLPEDLGAIITTGKDSWKEESLFTLTTSGDYGVIECAPATTVEADVLKKGEQLVMTFEFTVKAEAEGLINFQLSNKGLVGYSWDLTAAEAAGAGSNLAVENADNYGDTGIYVIAALALVALIGTAVVIKKRA